jgi:sulfur-carrier protein
MLVRIPSPLRSYTAQLANVEGCGATVTEVVDDLETRFPGIRFRMVDEQGHLRQHMRVFVNDEMAALHDPVTDTDQVTIMAALSGG